MLEQQGMGQICCLLVHSEWDETNTSSRACFLYELCSTKVVTVVVKKALKQAGVVHNHISYSRNHHIPTLSPVWI